MTDVSSSSADTADSPHWDAQLSAMFFDFVDNVRSKTTGPLLMVVRALVYGIVILVAAVILLALLLILLVRLLAIIPGELWIAYLGAGALFFIVGTLSWSRRTL